jgi:Tol biopolymer transport system component
MPRRWHIAAAVVVAAATASAQAQIEPEGRIVVANGGSDVTSLLVRAIGDERVRPELRRRSRPTVPAVVDAPAWLPDGRSVAFQYERSGAFLGSTGTAATPGGLPAGAELVYSADLVGARDGRLHLLSGSSERPITPLRPGRVEHPSWSPARRELAFSSRPGDALWLYDAERRSTRLLALADADLIVWSPRADRLAVALLDRVTIVNREDGRLQRVPLPARISISSVAWAPDGRRILVAGDSGTGSSLFIAEPQRRWRRIGPRARRGFTHWGVTWSRDGRSIAFGLSDLSTESVQTLDLSTGRVRRFPAGDNPTWVKGSRRLGTTNGRSVTIYDLVAGTRRTFRVPVEATELLPTADGRSLVVLGGTRLYELDLARARTRTLQSPRHLLLNHRSTVSPYADAVAVIDELPNSGGASSDRLDLVLPDGRRTRVAGPSSEISPSWLDHWRLVFERQGTIVLLDLRTRRERRLGIGANPLPSPDGTAVLVEQGDNLVLLSPSGGAARTIGRGSQGAWAPDGRVAFVRNDNELRVWSLGREPERLVVSVDDGAPCKWLGAPDWSPDGASIAVHFYAEEEFGDVLCGPHVFDVSAVDGHLRAVAHDAAAPRWSPDGTRLLVAADGLVVLARDGHRVARWPGRHGVWSPNGDWIAYNPVTSGDLWIRRPDGTAARRVSRTRRHGSALDDPAWRPAR